MFSSKRGVLPFKETKTGFRNLVSEFTEWLILQDLVGELSDNNASMWLLAETILQKLK